MIFDTSAYSLEETQAMRDYAFDTKQWMICHALDVEIARRKTIRNFLLEYTEFKEANPG